MTTTIARLAAVITADNAPFAAKLRESGAMVQTFDAQFSSGMSRVSDSAKLARHSMEALGGNLTKLGSIGAAGGAAAGTALLVAGIGRATFAIAEMGDAARVENAKIRDEFEQTYKEITGRTINVGGGVEDTWAGQWKEAKDQIATTVAILDDALGISRFFEESARGLAATFREINDATMSDAMKKERAQAEALKKQTEELKVQDKLRKEAAEVAKKAAAEADAAARRAQEEAKRAADEIVARGEAIARSLRTPAEVYRDTIAELGNLFSAGAIGIETFNRGVAKAKEDLEGAKNAGRPQGLTNVGAAERFTMTGFSAVNRAQDAATKAAAETAKNSKYLERLKSIDETLQRNKEMNFILMRSNL